MYSGLSPTDKLPQRLPGDDSDHSAHDHNAIPVIIRDPVPGTDASDHDNMLTAVKDLIDEAEGPEKECIEYLLLLLAINDGNSKDEQNWLDVASIASLDGISEDEDDEEFHRAVSYWNPSSPGNEKEEDASDEENDPAMADYGESDEDDNDSRDNSKHSS